MMSLTLGTSHPLCIPRDWHIRHAMVEVTPKDNLICSFVDSYVFLSCSQAAPPFLSMLIAQLIKMVSLPLFSAQRAGKKPNEKFLVARTMIKIKKYERYRTKKVQENNVNAINTRVESIHTKETKRKGWNWRRTENLGVLWEY